MSANSEAALAEPRLLSVILDGMGVNGGVRSHPGELRLLGGRRRRIGELMPLPVPRGNRERPEPWRTAVAALFILGAKEVPRRLRCYPSAPLLHALHCGLDLKFVNAPSFLFDAVAGLLDVESAARLEDLAGRHGTVEPLAWGYALSSDGGLDFLPLLEDLIDIDDAPLGAALFHATFARGLAEWIIRAAATYGVHRVALVGDCFDNRVLTRALAEQLQRAGCACVVKSDASARPESVGHE